MINERLLSYFGIGPTGDFGPLTFYTAKNKKPVWFAKAPPKTPPTARQLFVRGRLGYIGRHWSTLSKETKAKWELASKRAHLRMTGYDLFQWWHWHNDRNVIATIEHQSGIQLLA